jgi:hypothetical protein
MNREGRLQARYGFSPKSGWARLGFSDNEYPVEVIVVGIPEGCPGNFCETAIAEYMLKNEDYNDPNQRIVSFKKIGADKLWGKLKKASKIAAKKARKR